MPATKRQEAIGAKRRYVRRAEGPQQKRRRDRKQQEAMASNASAGNRRKDIYTRVTDRIVAQLEAGVRPWIKPWSADHATGRITRPLRHNGLPYAGINILMLWAEAVAKGFGAPTWMTYRQAQELGAQVRKGEKSALVVYANTVTRTEETDDSQEIEREIPFMRGYAVFNVEQIDGLPDHFYLKPEPVNPGVTRDQALERFVAATGADIRHGGAAAYYAPNPDYIRMPPFESFRDAASYYSTILHELAHWAGHPGRLNRDLGRKTWGDKGYAREELVAELAAAFLCADLAVAPEIREDHAAYLGHWLGILKKDSRAIFAAAAHAQRAADYLHGLQNTAPSDP